VLTLVPVVIPGAARSQKFRNPSFVGLQPRKQATNVVLAQPLFAQEHRKGNHDPAERGQASAQQEGDTDQHRAQQHKLDEVDPTLEWSQLPRGFAGEGAHSPTVVPSLTRCAAKPQLT